MHQISNKDYNLLLQVLKGVIFGLELSDYTAVANHQRKVRALYKKLIKKNNMTGIISDYVLHICNVAEGTKNNLFAVCYRNVTTPKVRNYEELLMKKVVMAMKKLKLITNHGTLEMPDFEVLVPRLANKVRDELAKGKISISADDAFDFKKHRKKLLEEQPILESIREMTYSLFHDEETVTDETE